MVWRKLSAYTLSMRKRRLVCSKWGRMGGISFVSIGTAASSKMLAVFVCRFLIVWLIVHEVYHRAQTATLFFCHRSLCYSHSYLLHPLLPRAQTRAVFSFLEPVCYFSSLFPWLVPLCFFLCNIKVFFSLCWAQCVTRFCFLLFLVVLLPCLFNCTTYSMCVVVCITPYSRKRCSSSCNPHLLASKLCLIHTYLLVSPYYYYPLLIPYSLSHRTSLVSQ